VNDDLSPHHYFPELLELIRVGRKDVLELGQVKLVKGTHVRRTAEHIRNLFDLRVFGEKVLKTCDLTFLKLDLGRGNDVFEVTIHFDELAPCHEVNELCRFTSMDYELTWVIDLFFFLKVDERVLQLIVVKNVSEL